MNNLKLSMIALPFFLMIPGLGYAVDTVQQVKFVSAGVGDDDPLLATKKDYNLHLLFAKKGSGEYLADVNVSVQDAAGSTLVSTMAGGPLFFARLPPGNYRISVEFEGKPLGKSVSLGRNESKDLYFYW